MAKFLDTTGLTTLWSKIKSTFLPLTGGTLDSNAVITQEMKTDSEYHSMTWEPDRESKIPQLYFYTKYDSNIDATSMTINEDGIKQITNQAYIATGSWLIDNDFEVGYGDSVGNNAIFGVSVHNKELMFNADYNQEGELSLFLLNSGGMYLSDSLGSTTTYKIGSIENTHDNETTATLTLPTKDGTLALTSDIPDITAITTDELNALLV